jgi:leader peptidase (prepilin peptidase) / N-methyltransferase
MSSLGWLAQPAALPWVALVFGLCIGSFLNVVIHRLPRMMEREWREQCAELAGSALPSPEETYNLVRPRSACPACGHPIHAWENIPLLSWLVLRGRCSACGTRISARYLLVELLAGLGAAYAAARFGATLAGLAAALFIWFTIALAFIDQQTGYLPDDLTLPLLWIGLLANLGWKFLPLVILVSSLVGLLFGSLQMFSARRGWDWKFRFHFGPYLALAGVIALFWGPAIMQRYPLLRFAG